MCKLKKNGTVFYTAGNITVCLLIEDGVPVARGLGIFSRLDTFDPAIGRDYAVSRAKEALGRKCECGEILIDAARGNAYDWFDSSLAKDLFGNYKGYYMPTLTNTEKLLLKFNGKTIKAGTNKAGVKKPVVAKENYIMHSITPFNMWSGTVPKTQATPT